MYKLYDTDEFIRRCIIKHGNKYDYSQVVFTKTKESVKIICPEHGLFEQMAGSHLRGFKCKKCGNVGRKEKLSSNKNEFIKKSKEIHRDKYDYSLVEYKTNKIPVNIKCLVHGTFEQTPNMHLKGYGCNSCGVEAMRKTKLSNNKKFIKKAKLKHGNKYNYSLVDYSSSNEKVIIICKIHGKFEQIPNGHLTGNGCIKCGYDSNGKSKLSNTEEFIKKAKIIHGDIYDYSQTKYINSEKKVNIICKKHGVFKQTPDSHIRSNGCQTCRESKGEKKIRKFLKENNIKYLREKRFAECRNKNPLPFDFYLVDKNILIEYDGEYHFLPVWGEERLKYIKNNDRIKNQFVKNNNIDLIRITYEDFDNVENILEGILLEW